MNTVGTLLILLLLRVQYWARVYSWAEVGKEILRRDHFSKIFKFEGLFVHQPYKFLLCEGVIFCQKGQMTPYPSHPLHESKLIYYPIASFNQQHVFFFKIVYILIYYIFIYYINYSLHCSIGSRYRGDNVRM